MNMKEKLKREPINIDKNTWYYEERHGITVVHEVRTEAGNYQKTVQIKLPWKKLLASCERKYL